MTDPAYVRPIGDAIEDAEGGQPDVLVGVDYDKVTIQQAGADPIRLDAAQAEDFAALYVAACWQAARNAERMRQEADR